MPLSLQLPYAVCYPITCLARKRAVSRLRPPARLDQSAYFEQQYRSSERLCRRYMANFPLSGKVVLDVGSGLGGRAPFWIEQGAEQVFCIDINRQELDAGKVILAKRFPNFAEKIIFCHPDQLTSKGIADVAIMFDTFEHLVDPAAVLLQVAGWLKNNGKVWIGSIGWYNYMASHCLGHIPIPWCQLLFSEKAIIRTIRTVIHRSDYVLNVWEQLEGRNRWDNVRRLKDRPGEPLNQLSLRGIRRVLRRSSFDVEEFRVHALSGSTHAFARPASWLSRIPVLREIFHSYYTAVLVKRNENI